MAFILSVSFQKRPITCANWTHSADVWAITHGLLCMLCLARAHFPPEHIVWLFTRFPTLHCFVEVLPPLLLLLPGHTISHSLNGRQSYFSPNEWIHSLVGEQEKKQSALLQKGRKRETVSSWPQFHAHSFLFWHAAFVRFDLSSLLISMSSVHGMAVPVCIESFSSLLSDYRSAPEWSPKT